MLRYQETDTCSYACCLLQKKTILVLQHIRDSSTLQLNCFLIIYVTFLIAFELICADYNTITLF